MSSDNEMVAMRSGGISSRIVAPPVVVFATLALSASAACALWLNPLAIRAEVKLLNTSGAAQITADVQPHVFQEQFSNDNTVLFVDDVASSVGAPLWKGVFIADITPPAERKSIGKEQTTFPRITTAKEAIAVPDVAHHRVQLT